MNPATLRAFPCHYDKVPLTTRWQEARVSRSWAAWPLVGVATGAASGFDVLDIDPPDGLAWYNANFDALPTTRAHTTKRGGLHLLFRSAPGLRSSASRIAAGVDVRADGGYVIWWPREGLPIEDGPLAEWPEWLLKEAMGPKSKGPPRMVPSKFKPIHDVGDLAEALRKLKPERWRNSEANPEAFLEWFALMQACKFVGIERVEFVEWSKHLAHLSVKPLRLR